MNNQDWSKDLKISLMKAIREKHEKTKSTQTETANFLEISQPKFSDIIRLKTDKFSLEKLMVLAKKMNVSVKVKINKDTF